MKTARMLREFSSFSNRNLPTKRKVEGKAAKHYLRVAARCERDAVKFDELAKQARDFQARTESFGSIDTFWQTRAEEHEKLAIESRRKASEYRRLAGK